MFILEYFSTSKSFASARDVFNIVCSGNEASDKITINRRTTKFCRLKKQQMQHNIPTHFISLLEKKLKCNLISAQCWDSPH
jgi:hypothetical protein